jgi:lysophospholipase L1-like esterase
MKEDNNFGRLLTLLLLTLVVCIGLYGLPGTILKQKIKKVDILADIRPEEGMDNALLDSLRMQLEDLTDGAASIPAEATADDDLAVLHGDTTADDTDDWVDVPALLRDSITRVINSGKGIADAKGARIEDYSAGRLGLRRFFEALSRSRERTVRIAFMGDSFVEGDIMVADFRSAMQQQFGGHGVGFVPVSSMASQYRPTISQKSEGWKKYTIINDRRAGYTLSGMLFEARSEQAYLSFSTTSQYPGLRTVNSLKLLYDRNEETHMQLIYGSLLDTVVRTLPPALGLAQFELKDTISEGSFTFTNAKNFRALGIALEDGTGVVVDNYSLRGNSGLVFENLDPDACRALREIRPYDLIILQYGINAINEDMLDYGWYGLSMQKVIKHLKNCFPETDILLISTPDRADRYNGKFSTMPAVLALLNAQRHAARAQKIPFWNMFGAMGGENSMVRYVENGWAGKDYTHLNFRGGREIAQLLMKALMSEKEFYNVQ